VYHRYLLGELGQVQSFFHCSITSADSNDLFALKEWRITGPAVADACAGTAKFFFAGDAEFAIVTSRS
jgi:hypothetical protein